MEFEKSKKAGDIIEEELLRILRKKYPKAFTTKHKGKFSDYDIYIPEVGYGIEIKGDYKSAETGNLVIEVEMNGKPSALSVTKAEYWVFVEGYRLIWIKPIDIYRFLEQRFYYGRVPFIGNGDTKQKQAYLVNHNEFVKYVEKVGMIHMIPKNSVIYFDNFTKRLDLINENKTISI